MRPRIVAPVSVVQGPRATTHALAITIALATVACGESSAQDGEPDAPGGRASGGAGSGSGGSSAAGGSGGTSTGGSGGSGELLVPYFQPGARLKPEVVTAPGSGLEYVQDWFDSELGMRCLFERAEDGAERCFPRAIGANRYFMDAACASPLFLGSFWPSAECPSEVPSHFTYEGAQAPDGCGAAIGLRTLGELPSSMQIFQQVADVCEPVDRAELGGRVLYETERLPPEAFVRFEYAQRPFQSGLDAFVREGDDGSWEVLGFFDIARGAPCFTPYLPPEVPDLRCMPPYASISGFADPSCELRAAAVDPWRCEIVAPAVLADLPFVDGTCPPQLSFELYEIAEVRETELYENDGVCAPDTIETEPIRLYVQGAPIEPGALPLLEFLEIGAGRLRGRFFGLGAVPLTPQRRAPFWLDSSSGETCNPLEFADGTLRCAPSWGGPGSSTYVASEGSLLYTGASCSGARVVAAPSDRCGTSVAPPSWLVVYGRTTACSSDVIREVVALSGIASPTELHRRNSETGACEPINPADFGVAFLSLGEALDPADLFAEMELAVRY